MTNKKCYLNKQSIESAKKLGYPVDVISKKKPKNSIKLGETSCFRRFAKGNKNYLVAQQGDKLVYE